MDNRARRCPNLASVIGPLSWYRRIVSRFARREKAADPAEVAVEEVESRRLRERHAPAVEIKGAILDRHSPWRSYERNAVGLGPAAALSA